MTPVPQVQCLVKRWQHHTASGGYDRLAREIGADVVRRPGEGGVFFKAARMFWKSRTRTAAYLLDYHFEDYLAEWRVLWRAQMRRPGVAHVLFGDEQLDLLLRRRRLLPCPLVVTFHLPTTRPKVVERFDRWQKSRLPGIDAAVVVSRCQLADFKRWLGPDKVVYVPHGIDTEKFCPGQRTLARDRARFVVVGEHMRDWEATHRIIDACAARKLPVEFDVVARPEFWPHFTGCANVRLHAGIPEEKLLSLYRQADALLVPVTDATANNAALEALACGTPVISNAIGGIPDYVDSTCGWLFGQGEVGGIVDLIAGICADREVAGARRADARKKSLEFSWPRVVGQLEVVYRAVAEKKSPARSLAEWERRPLPSLSPISV